MSYLLGFFLLIYLLFFLITTLASNFFYSILSTHKPHKSHDAHQKGADEQEEFVAMVPCHYCNTYLEQSQAIVRNHKYFCCHEHSRLSS